MRPSFADLTHTGRAQFGNGLGPRWMPAAARDWITQTASFFFQRASWRHHDFGYVRGGTEIDRWRCDTRFFRAMMADASTQKCLLKIPPAIALSTLFFAAVALVGWTRFYYGRMRTIDEIRQAQAK